VGAEANQELYVGRSTPSLKGAAQVSGRVKYTNDFNFPGQLYAQYVRSPYASAIIRSVDLSGALKFHGVLLALDGEMIKQQLNPIPHGFDPGAIGGNSVDIYCLAVGSVCYEGEPVAVVVASDKETAAEAAKRVRVDYEIRAAVVEAEQAKKPDSPLVIPKWGTNVMIALPFVDGDAEAAFKSADHIVKAKIKIHRFSTQPIETRAYNAVWDDEEEMVTLYATAHSPHVLRYYLSRTLRLSENRIRVIAPASGGTFGLKMQGLPEEALTCHLARLCRKPVKWVETREECLQIGSREQEHEIEFALNDAGRVLAIRDQAVANVGAPSANLGWCMAYLTGLTMPGPYDIPNMDVHIDVVVSNKAPWNSARGYGKEATALALEFMMDKAARQLGIDPVEIRLRNYIQASAFPKKTPMGLHLDSGDYAGATLKALEEVGYADFRARQPELRRQGRLVGIGVAYEIVPEGGALPGSFLSGFDTATVKVDPSGSVTVTTGVTDPGTGNATGIAQIVADELGVQLDNIRVVHGDTATCPYGVGNYSGRSIINGGGAAALAARRVRALVVKVAAAMLEVPDESIQIVSGTVSSAAKPERSLTLAEVSFVAHTHPHDIASCIEPPLEVTSTCRPDWINHVPDEKGRINTYTSYANGAYVAAVEIDPETGVVTLLRIRATHDCGKIINPSMVEGQVSGAIAFGIGGMLGEQILHGENGKQITRTFGDYVMPRALDIPYIGISHHNVPNPVTLFGVKGAGESGLGGSAAALVNAVNDALAPLGVEVTEFPLSAQNVWKAIQRSSTKSISHNKEPVHA
jgi:aerobic carbon-monoxide dehydrogenase large subunit